MKKSKYDIKKEWKNLYKANKVAIIELPAMQYIGIRGSGNPNKEDFGKRVEALYALAYTISMSYKNNFEIDGYYQFVVPPLEGEWDTISGEYDGNKENLKYILMIAMPKFVTEEVLETAKERAYQKKTMAAIKDVEFFAYDEVKVCVALHKGSYDSEPETFETMKAFIQEKGYARNTKYHREIYLSDARKTAVENLKTVLVFPVASEAQ